MPPHTKTPSLRVTAKRALRRTKRSKSAIALAAELLVSEQPRSAAASEWIEQFNTDIDKNDLRMIAACGAACELKRIGRALIEQADGLNKQPEDAAIDVSKTVADARVLSESLRLAVDNLDVHRRAYGL